ncbi:hypothetical protein LINPERPRIM_LOCUS2292 [Linum perenne]
MEKRGMSYTSVSYVCILETLKMVDEDYSSILTTFIFSLIFFSFSFHYSFFFPLSIFALFLYQFLHLGPDV